MCQCQCVNQIIKNPDQTEFQWPVHTLSESYQNGYETGISWDANWIPGGPLAYNVNSFRRLNPDPKFVKIAEDSQRAHDDWHAGFKRALDERLKNNDHFAQWWHTNKSQGYLRYVDPHNQNY
jgi:hypothetical protein